MRYWSARTQLIFLLYVNQFVIDRPWTWSCPSHLPLIPSPGHRWVNPAFKSASAVSRSAFINSGYFLKPNNIAGFLSIACLRLHRPKWLVLQRHKSLGGRLSAESARGPQEGSVQSSSYLIMRAKDPWVHGFILPQQRLANKLCWVPLIDLKPFEVAVKRQRRRQKEGGGRTTRAGRFPRGRGKDGEAGGMEGRNMEGKRKGDGERDVSGEPSMEAGRGNEGWRGARRGWMGREREGWGRWCLSWHSLFLHTHIHTHTHTFKQHTPWRCTEPSAHTRRKHFLTGSNQNTHSVLLELLQYQGSRDVDVFA